MLPWYKTEISRTGENRGKPCRVCKNLISLTPPLHDSTIYSRTKRTLKLRNSTIMHTDFKFFMMKTLEKNLNTQYCLALPILGVLPSPGKPGFCHPGFPGRSILCQPWLSHCRYFNKDFFRNVPWIVHYQPYAFCPNCWIWLVAMATERLNFRNNIRKFSLQKLKLCRNVNIISLY